MNEFFLLMKDLDMNLHSDLEPIGVAVKSENEAIQFVENGKNRSQRRGYQKIKIIDKYSEPVIRRKCKMNIELSKFITDLDEFMKKKQNEMLTEEYIRSMCEHLGSVEVEDAVGNKMTLRSAIMVQGLSVELRNILMGVIASMIYEYQAFAVDFMEKEETDEDENID